MNKKIAFSILMFALSLTAFTSTSAQSVLDAYIAEGLENNIVLQQKKISLEKALFSLKNATTLFLPSVTLLGDYTSGEGGRRIDIPVGDMLNPVYSTLNQLTASYAFPQINNVSQDFFPYKFYDAKLRATMPLLNSDLIYNRRIQATHTGIKELEVDLYKRELIKEIKVAYFHYLASLRASDIYSSALSVAQESKRINEALLKNGAGLPVYVARAESEISQLDAQVTEAKQASSNAQSFFNFLLNRALSSEIDSSFRMSSVPDTATEITVERREEVKMLDKAISINRSLQSMHRLYFLPRINGFADLGAQDSEFHYDKSSKYYLFGVQMSIPIFEGFRNRHKIESAKLDVRDAELTLISTKKQLALAASMAKGALESAHKNLLSSAKQLSAAEQYHKLINLGYQQGVNSYIETVDARSQLLNAQLLVNINQYKVLAAQAGYEREIAALDIHQ